MTHPAMVLIGRADPEWPAIRVGDAGAMYHVPAGALHPMPPTITPEQRAVLDAAVKQERAGSIVACIRTDEAVRALRKSLAPVDPVAELLEAAKEVAELSPQHARLRAAIAALEVKP